MREIRLTRTCVIRRPLSIVRMHFLDFDHHIEHQVHRAVRIQKLEGGDLQRIATEIKLLGLTKRDEQIVYLNPEGEVIQEFVGGDFVGGRIRIRFREDGAEESFVDTEFQAPRRGALCLLGPLVSGLLRKVIDQTVDEDQRDLELGSYQRGAA